MMPKQECKNCKYLVKTNRIQEFFCGHKEVNACAKRYEKEKKKRISKGKDFIGYRLPKSCLRWCPLKYLENDINAISAGGKNNGKV